MFGFPLGAATRLASCRTTQLMPTQASASDMGDGSPEQEILADVALPTDLSWAKAKRVRARR